MWWIPNPLSGWDYAILVINMVLLWGLLVVVIIGLFRYLARHD